MRLQNLFLGMFLWGAAIHPVFSAASPVLQAKLHPAVYKSSSGPVRRVAVTVGYDGQAAEAELALGRQVRHVRLEEGENHFVFDIPDAGTDRTLPLSLRAGQVSWASDEVKVPVARHWQMNLVQHTHTDIGYTRSQMEILAEHLRYIDYALDYCDATNHYPDAAVPVDLRGGLACERIFEKPSGFPGRTFETQGERGADRVGDHVPEF